MKISEEEYRIAVSLGNNIIGRYSIQDKTLTIPSEISKRFSLPEVMSGIPDEEENIQKVSIDTKEAYLNFFKIMKDGAEKGVVVYRRLFPDGWRWISAKFSSIKNNDEKPVSVVISFIDITDFREKEITYEKWSQSLNERSKNSYTLICCNIDKETIFNRKAGNLLQIPISDKPFWFNDYTEYYSAEKVDNIINSSKPESQHALLMLDIDYFKQINDILGHSEGDKALIDIAKLLKSMARSYDLVGRLGGDEFFVFLQDIPNDIIAVKRQKVSVKELKEHMVTRFIFLQV